MPLDKTQPGIAELYADLVQTSQIGSETGQIPVIPVLMAQMSTPVKSTIDAITAQGGPAWIATITNSAAVAAAIATEQGARSASDATLTSAIANETSARQSAIVALSAQLTTDESTAAALLAAVNAITPHKTSATVDFGYAGGNGEGDYATTTVSASWVTSTSRIICRCAPADSLDHTTDETIAEGITFDAVNIVPGTSFDVKAFAPNGTWGRHDCVILGL